MSLCGGGGGGGVNRCGVEVDSLEVERERCAGVVECVLVDEEWCAGVVECVLLECSECFPVSLEECLLESHARDCRPLSLS